MVCVLGDCEGRQQAAGSKRCARVGFSGEGGVTAKVSW